MLEQLADGVGAKTSVEDMIKEMVCMPSASRAKAKANEIVTTADRQNTSQDNAHTSKYENTRARDSKKSVTNVARKGIPVGSARKARKNKKESRTEKETLYIGKGQG